MSDLAQEIPQDGERPLLNIPKAGYFALREYRHSEVETEYFLTTNLATRGRGLEQRELTAQIMARWAELEARQVWLVRTAVVMPDHVHLLVVLGRTLNLAEVLRIFKGPLTPALRSAGLAWQVGYYDRKLRANEDRMPVFHYIYLNPYRERLIERHQKWPGYYCRPEDWRWYGNLTDSGCPMPEWLQ